MKQRALVLVFAGFMGILPLNAGALEIVMGTGNAHDCFALAKAGVNANQGIESCDAALRDDTLTQHDRAATFINRGVMKMSLSQVSDAMNDYESGLALMPDLGDAHVDKGAALITLRRYDDALVEINKGIDMGMSYPYIGYFNRAVAEELMGRFKEAYFDFKHVLELEPNFTKATEQLKNFTVTTVRKPAGT